MNCDNQFVTRGSPHGVCMETTIRSPHDEDLNGATVVRERSSAAQIEWKGKTVHTAVWKEAVRGRRKVKKVNIEGNGQGDLQVMAAVEVFVQAPRILESLPPQR